MQDPCTENDKHCWKKLKKFEISGKTSHVHELGNLILLRWQYTKAIHWFNAIPIKIPAGFFEEIESWFQIPMEMQEIQSSKIILKKKSNFEGLIFSDFKTYYVDATVKTVGLV